MVIPLEILRVRPELPLELVIFAEEEGTTFSLGMLGSRAWSGAMDLDLLEQLKNRHGRSPAEAGASDGLDLTRLRAADSSGAPAPWTDRLDPRRYLGLVEVHAEQGVSLWDAGLPVAVVDRINGRRQFEITVTGQANHAGSTGMTGRRDALAGAAEMVTAIEALGRKLDGQAPYSVCTVGRMVVAPGAVNVIPGEVFFSVDMRGQEEELLQEGEDALRQAAGEIASRRGLGHVVTRSEAIPPAPLSAEVGRALHEAAAEVGLDVPIRPSGALHDAAILADQVPTAMIFVASRQGISHNPAEFSRIEDIVRAAEVLSRMIEGHPRGAGTTTEEPITLAQLNTLPMERVEGHCGGFFEDSPWIVKEALGRRPFNSLKEFHAACLTVIADAGEEAQLALIRAHPDLVGRLAKAGRLGTESTREQSAAGLAELTPEEAEAFDRYNAEYHTRFGFPFVICARKNRKEAILEAFPVRLKNDREAEIATALEQIAEIAWLRMADAITEEKRWQS